MEKRYTVAQTTEMTGVKSYVLRYWEEELDLRIGRNELGHRYYTGYDIQLFLNIKELKNRGLQLKAIKDLIPQIAHTAPGSAESKIRLLEGEKAEGISEDKPEAKSEAEIIREELLDREDNQQEPRNSEKILEFQEILERLIAQEIHAKNDGEKRCRSLDEAIRRQQLARKEAAAASDKKNRKKNKVHS
ncbi:MerR family transcriptional regulator [Ruminococcus sp. 5_1_39BFAA]|uniref:MerR family transcriptional regulator n=1 Tax=Ruminococcus sp. 5_1_39BFAA TaxID=457412 RepID=UPI003563D0BE